MAVPVLILPGWGDSGPGHWQSLWEHANPALRRVVQRDWEYPICTEWVRTLDDVIRAAGNPAILVAHSLGCIAVAHWARASTLPVRGALLVAPPDIEHPDFPPVTEGFAPIPRERLPFPSILVASRNDQFSDFNRSRALAHDWGSRFVDAGNSGHINTDAGFGPWPLGESLLAELSQGAAASSRRSES
jgi:predicted alpha/beta hydrolase family esterase